MNHNTPRFSSLVCFAFVAILFQVVCIATDSTSTVKNDPLEPVIAEASNEPQEALASIATSEGWNVNVHVAEPLVANIVAFDIDNKGRIYVCESYRQDRGVTDNRAHDEKWVLADLASQTVQDRIDYHRRLLGDAAVTYAQHDDRIRRLFDTDSDGKPDESKVVANGFNRLEEGTGAGILVRGSDIYYSCIPRLWKLSDADGDGKAESRIALSDGYGVRVAFRGHDMHGLIIGPDGRLYFSIGDRGYHISTADGNVIANPAVGAIFRCELDGSGLEVFCNGLRNPQELAFNDFGDWFSVDNNSDSGDKARIVQLLEGSDAGWRMYYQYLPDRGPFNAERLWEPHFPEQASYITPPIANFTDGPSGLAYYPGTGFGDELKDRFLICDFRGTASQSGVRSFKLKQDGASYELETDDKPVWSVLATDVAFGPDGAMYVSDWVDGWTGVGKARLYRVSHPDYVESAIVSEVQSLLASDWSGQSDVNLIEALRHVDRRVRLEAQWELARRGSAKPFIMLAGSADERRETRLHAIWGADQIARQQAIRASEVGAKNGLQVDKVSDQQDSSDSDNSVTKDASATIKNESQREAIFSSLRSLLEDDDEVIRSAAAKSLGERGDVVSRSRLITMLADSSARVRYHATMALMHMRATNATHSVVDMLAANGNVDTSLRHAGQMFLASVPEVTELLELSQHPDESVRRSVVVGLRRRGSGEVANFLADESELVSLEAARAIHDVPIPVAFADLAKRIESPTANEPLLRRIINANYRLGKPESAVALAQFSTKLTAPEAMRVEALDCLMNWSTPDPRDRVLNDYRPLGERSPNDAANALTPMIEKLMLSNEAIREKTIEVAAALKIQAIAPTLLVRVSDKTQKARLRASAIRGLSQLDPAEAVKQAKAIPLNPANVLVEAALDVLAKHDPENSVDTFIKATQSRNVSVQQLAWDLLAHSDTAEAKSTIETAVESYLGGDLADELKLNVVEAAQSLGNEKLSEKIRQYEERLSQSDPLAPWHLSLKGGDPEKGSALFYGKTELSCVRCHRVHRTGGEVGPLLTTIGKEKDNRYLLEAICLPDAKIAKGFETAVIANDNGQVFTGIVKTDNHDVVELIQNDGTITRILQDEIIARKSGKSAMPADLVKHISKRELRDLVAYLESLKVDPRTVDDGEVE